MGYLPWKGDTELCLPHFIIPAYSAKSGSEQVTHDPVEFQ